VVGFASGGPERTGDPLFRGDLLAIYLLQAYQGKGLGRLLIRAVVERLLGQDIGSLLVWVLAQNPSRRFYERLGGERVKERSIVLGGADLVEVAYGWRDAGVLLAP
jgi:GNAT superfamily N-acetyltransferase